MKIIIAPDKFKGSLTSFEVCKAISNGLLQVDVKPEILSFPMADGGDGFSSVMQYYFNTTAINCLAQDPLGRNIETTYQWNSDSKTAIIELATTSGLVLLDKSEQNPLYTSTYGTGLQVKDAITKGANKIILGIGGSATNDAGMGILECLGFRFLDENGQPLQPYGKNLIAIEKILPPNNIPAIKIEIVCDVQNVLYGIEGAAFVYGSQKGANEEEITLLDDGLKNFASILYKQTGRDISQIPGTGAAGGIAAGLMGFFDVSLVEGTKMIIGYSGIEHELSNVNLLITGEGKIDNQSGKGKVVGEMAALGLKYNIPVIAYCGITELDKKETTALGLKAIYSMTDNKNDIASSINNAAKYLQDKTIATLPSVMALLYGNKFP